MNLLKISIWYSLALIISFNVFPQDEKSINSWAEIKGNVIDYETKEPLIGVTVVLDSNTYETSTDIYGDFIINKVESGYYKLKFEYILYETQILDSIELKAGETKTINIEMKGWGKLEAEKDINNGNVMILVEGLVALCKPLDIINELCKEYGFKYELTGCVPIGVSRYNARVYDYLDELNGEGWKDKFKEKLDELCNK